MQWIARITHKFIIVTQVNIIHSSCSQSFQLMTLNAFEQFGMI